MAFFCPGSTLSSSKMKKDYDTSKGHRSTQHELRNQGHLPYPPHSHRSLPGRAGPYSSNRPPFVADKPSPTAPIGNQFLQKMVVVLDYQPQSDDGLAVRKGERVEVIDKNVDWLMVRNEKGKEGMVPRKNCVAPMSSLKRRPIPLRTVGSSSNGREQYSKKSIPLYSSNSAGHPHRPYTTLPSAIHRVVSPPSYVRESNGTQEVSSTTLDPKHSPSSSSGVASDPYSPALNGHEDLCYQVENCNISSSSQVPLLSPTQNDGIVHRKQSSSDDSGTEVTGVTITNRGEECVQNGRGVGDSSSEDGSHKGRSSSRTPSMRDRPLPSPPTQAAAPMMNYIGSSSTLSANTPPPPVPPRNNSLEHQASLSKQQAVSDQYASPVDSLMGGETNELPLATKYNTLQQPLGKSLMEISTGDNGVYTEVFRSHKQPRRQSTVSELRASESVKARRSASFNRHRSSGSLSVERRGSPGLMTGSKRVENSEGLRQMTKFRKYLWGVFVVLQDFEGLDENEVNIKAGENVLVFNQDDRDWFWVVKHKTDNSEGFVPSSHLQELVISDPKTTKAVSAYQADIRRRSSSAGTRPTNRHHIPALPTVPDRLNPEGSKLKSFGSSTEKMSLPSSPPPPYQELDPTPHYRSSATYSHQHQDRSSTMTRTRSTGRNRVTQHHPLISPRFPIPHNPGLSNSHQQLISPMEPGFSYPVSPTSPTGTLV